MPMNTNLTDEQKAALLKFEDKLCVQFDGEVLIGDFHKAYFVWHDEVRPLLGLPCPVVEDTGEHGEWCP